MKIQVNLFLSLTEICYNFKFFLILYFSFFEDTYKLDHYSTEIKWKDSSNRYVANA